MLFDEHQLAPYFGCLFNPKWVSPHESLVSMLWKFGRANALPGHVLITQIARETIDPYEGISALRQQYLLLLVVGEVACGHPTLTSGSCNSMTCLCSAAQTPSARPNGA